jgi:hypothetical protein
MPDEQQGQLIPLALARVHPDFRGLSMLELRGQLAALLFHASDAEVIDVSWALGGALAPALPHEERLGPERVELNLQDGHDGLVVPEVEDQVSQRRKQAQLPLIGVVKPRKE